MLTTVTRLRRMASVTACLVLAGVVAGCGGSGGDSDPSAIRTSAEAEPDVGRWKTWVLPSASTIPVPPPPASGSDVAKADLAAVRRLAEERTPDVMAEIDRWSSPLPTQRWMTAAFDLVAAQAKNPPLSTRNYALIHGAMYDAMVASYHWKYEYGVKPPGGTATAIPAGADPSYPSEHAAMAGAASRVLAHLYPDESALRLDETGRAGRPVPGPGRRQHAERRGRRSRARPGGGRPLDRARPHRRRRHPVGRPASGRDRHRPRLLGAAAGQRVAPRRPHGRDVEGVGHAVQRHVPPPAAPGLRLPRVRRPRPRSSSTSARTSPPTRRRRPGSTRATRGRSCLAASPST